MAEGDYDKLPKDMFGGWSYLEDPTDAEKEVLSKDWLSIDINPTTGKKFKTVDEWWQWTSKEMAHQKRAIEAGTPINDTWHKSTLSYFLDKDKDLVKVAMEKRHKVAYEYFKKKYKPETAKKLADLMYGNEGDLNMTPEERKEQGIPERPKLYPKLTIPMEKSMVADPAERSKTVLGIEGQKVQTAWRMDKLSEMTYSEFWILVREHRIDKAKYTSDRRSLIVTTKPSAPGGERTCKVGIPFDPELFDHLTLNGVSVEIPDFNPVEDMLLSVFQFIFPIAAGMFLIQASVSWAKQKKNTDVFGEANLEFISPKRLGINFNDVAGIDSVKAEILELVNFLKNPKKYTDMGARIPTGILLVGPPGCGKTLLAKAIAGEAGVPFYSAAGSEFIQMFVGVGASRVRSMFRTARQKKPCIIFIDEFDAIGLQRSSTMGGDESVHTINQLLTEMDGFENNAGVVVLAATNRPGALDKALTRPGRFDRLIHLPLPNQKGRVEILQVHAKDKRIAADVDFGKIARATAGMTGAELMNLMNESAILTVREGREIITEKNILDALEKLQMEKAGLTGGSSQTKRYEGKIPTLLRKNIAVYEAGKALIGSITPYFDEVTKVSCCEEGQAMGFTYFIPQEGLLESRIMTRGYMESRMCMLMAGRCAERLILGEDNISTAGGTDIESANNIAREMVYRCGFGKRIGPLSFMDSAPQKFLKNGGIDSTQPTIPISKSMGLLALQDMEDMMEAAECKAYYGLVSNYKALQALTEALIEKTVLTGKEIDAILEQNNVQRFPNPFAEGFEWDVEGRLVIPREKGVWVTLEEGGFDVEVPRFGGSVEASKLKRNGSSKKNGNGAFHLGLESLPPLPFDIDPDLPNLLSEETLSDPAIRHMLEDRKRQSDQAPPREIGGYEELSKRYIGQDN